MFYASDKSQFFIVKYLAAFFGIYFLFREALAFMSLPVSRLNLLSFGLALSIFQFLWVISLLPIGFLNAGALTLVLILITKDMVFAHLSGNLNRTMILKNITLLIVFVLIIFAASKWAL